MSGCSTLWLREKVLVSIHVKAGGCRYSAGQNSRTRQSVKPYGYGHVKLSYMIVSAVLGCTRIDRFRRSVGTRDIILGTYNQAILRGADCRYSSYSWFRASVLDGNLGRRESTM